MEVRRDQLPRDIDKQQHHPGDHDQETALSYVKGRSKAANDTVYEYEHEHDIEIDTHLDNLSSSLLGLEA